MSAVCGPYRPFPTFMRVGEWSCSVVHEEQVAHLLGVGLPVQARQARFVQPAQPSCVFFRQNDRLAGAVGHGQRHCGRVHGVEVQVQDPADGLLGVVVLLAQLGVVGLSEGLEDAAQHP